MAWKQTQGGNVESLAFEVRGVHYRLDVWQQGGGTNAPFYWALYASTHMALANDECVPPEREDAKAFGAAAALEYLAEMHCGLAEALEAATTDAKPASPAQGAPKKRAKGKAR